MARVISLRGEPIIDEQDEAEEADILPGMLVELNPSTAKLRKHATAAGNQQGWFALERDEFGRDIDTAYAIGDRVKVGRFGRGMRVNALIASGQNITRGDALESAGNGTLRKAATDSATDTTQRTSLVGFAGETTGAVTTTTRLKVDVY